MKKISLMIIILLALALNAVAFDIGIEVKDIDYPGFKAAFLTTNPNTECVKYNLQTMECLQKRFTDDEWVRERIRRFAFDSFRSGQETIVKTAAMSTMDKTLDNKVMLKTSTETETPMMSK